MKIFLTHRPGGAYGYISDSWGNAITHLGHKVRRYDGNLKSWSDFDPDIYIGCSGHKQIIPSKNDRRAKVAIHCNPFGDTDLGPINESKQAIDWVKQQKPDVVFGYGVESQRHFWCKYESELGIKWCPMANAGDHLQFITLSNNDAHDLVYIGGRWDYKAKRLDQYLLPILRSGSMSFKLFGWGGWPADLPWESPNDNLVPTLYRLGKVAPCVSEPHTGEHGIDVPERVFKAILSGCLAIHDPVPGIKDMIPSLVVANNPQEFSDLCYYWSRPERDIERIELARKQREEVLANHTYVHRVQRLLEDL